MSADILLLEQLRAVVRNQPSADSLTAVVFLLALIAREHFPAQRLPRFCAEVGKKVLQAIEAIDLADREAAIDEAAAERSSEEVH